jgi:hypothetical protein
MSKRNANEPAETVADAEAERHAAANRAAAKRYAERLAARRRMFSFFGMWRVCPDKRCIRAKACSGDIHACTTERWRVVVPPEFKALLFKTVYLMNRGASRQEALRLAREDMEERRAAMAALATRFPPR